MDRQIADRSAPIIDIACGTGLVAAALVKHGFTNIAGIDLSPEMLRVADEKHIYRRIEQADITKQTTFAPGAFSVAVCAGAFTLGHLRPDTLVATLDILAPGGLFVCDIEAGVWESYGFRQTIDDLKQSNAVDEISRNSGRFYDIPDDQDPQGFFIVLKKPSTR